MGLASVVAIPGNSRGAGGGSVVSLPRVLMFSYGSGFVATVYRYILALH